MSFKVNNSILYRPRKKKYPLFHVVPTEEGAMRPPKFRVFRDVYFYSTVFSGSVIVKVNGTGSAIINNSCFHGSYGTS